jgi:hypothetical protein
MASNNKDTLSGLPSWWSGRRECIVIAMDHSRRRPWPEVWHSTLGKTPETISASVKRRERELRDLALALVGQSALGLVACRIGRPPVERRFAVVAGETSGHYSSLASLWKLEVQSLLAVEGLRQRRNDDARACHRTEAKRSSQAPGPQRPGLPDAFV